MLFLAFPFFTNAQSEGGVSLGLSSYQGDCHCRTDENIGLLQELNPSFGLLYKYKFNEAWALRGNLNYVALSADERNFANAGHAARGFNFDNTILELSAMAQWDLLGKRRMKDGVFKRTLSPYLFGGIGLGFMQYDVNYGTVDNQNVRNDQDASKTQFILPVGLGLNYYLTEKFGIGIETGLRLPVSDYYDGVSDAANPNENDLYGIGAVKLLFALGKKDTDGDGVADKLDKCPEVAGLVAMAGCPDADGDTVTDAEDACPNVAGKIENKGCPDADGDGIVDSKDSCPQTAGLEKFGGCPDTDGDGLADKDDACPEAAGTAENDGCPDSDGDGIVDKFDECPTVVGIISEKGCPMKDRDEDGIADADDACPDEKGIAEFGGCAYGDKDNDGVRDNVDNCPSLAGGGTASGCPMVKEPTVIEESLNFATKNVNFATGSRALTRGSYAALDDIARVLNAYPDQKIRINGYTDNVGNSVVNQKLSQARAKAAYDYLIGKGIDASRLSYAGYGEANAIASNATAEGRDANRRVEFVLADTNTPFYPGGTSTPNNKDCNCTVRNAIFRIPANATPRSLSRLGTNPEFGDSHALDGYGFYEKLKNAHKNSNRDRVFLDGIFQAMGYSGFADATGDMFTEVELPYGIEGNLGYSVDHKTLYAKINAKSDRDLKAFRIRSANGCDLHFMKTCGNHFFFCN